MSLQLIVSNIFWLYAFVELEIFEKESPDLKGSKSNIFSKDFIKYLVFFC